MSPLRPARLSRRERLRLTTACGTQAADSDAAGPARRGSRPRCAAAAAAEEREDIAPSHANPSAVAPCCARRARRHGTAADSTDRSGGVGLGRGRGVAGLVEVGEAVVDGLEDGEEDGRAERDVHRPLRHARREAPQPLLPAPRPSAGRGWAGRRRQVRLVGGGGGGRADCCR